MQRDPHDDSAEDAAWRAIVDNYGDRADLGPEVSPDLFEESADPPADPPADTPYDVADDEPDWFAAPLEDPEDRFVPPPAPPLPQPSKDRLTAWLGVFGAPAVLLVCLVAGISLPSLLAYALVAAFVGGFGYLVWQMPRGPRDPFDDGAQV